MTHPRDYFKNEILQGDIIAYPGRGSSSLWMNHGLVVEVYQKKKHSWQKEPCELVTRLRVKKLGSETSRTSTIECFDRIINLSRIAEFGVLDSIANPQRTADHDV
jgi:hypothetical protein